MHYTKGVIALIVSYLFTLHLSYAQELLKPLPKNIVIPRSTILTFNSAIPKQDKYGAFIPQNFYSCDLGFFCRQEIKMQQVHIPMVFRIGSMDECNYLEQKPGYTLPGK